MPDQTAQDPRLSDPSFPDWPLPDLLRAADAHWEDPARLRLLQRDLALRTEPGARDLLDRVAARLRELGAEAAPRPRVVRRDPAFLARAKAAPLPQEPTPEMASLLRQLQLERASGDSARREAALLRQRLDDHRARGPDPAAAARLAGELQAARAEARTAREQAARLAERLAFVSASAGRQNPDPAEAGPHPAGPRAARRPSASARADAAPAGRARPDPAYAELGLSPELPDDLLPVLERALLRHHHPDRAPPESRDAATRRFQAVTRAFERIRKLRGLSA